MKIDPLALETEAWLYGTNAFLEAIGRAVSEAESREADELRRRAQAQGWEQEEYFAEASLLREKFHHWLPRLSAYSVIILLQSLVETQLDAYANRLRHARGLRLALHDLQGKGTTRAKAYILKVAGIPIEGDRGWQELSNLQELRNIIVHRRGRQGAASKQQQAVQQLLKRYGADLSLSTTLCDPGDQELLVTFRLCSHLLREVEAFIRRLCRAAGFQEKGSTRE